MHTCIYVYLLLIYENQNLGENCQSQIIDSRHFTYIRSSVCVDPKFRRGVWSRGTSVSSSGRVSRQSWLTAENRHFIWTQPHLIGGGPAPFRSSERSVGSVKHFWHKLFKRTSRSDASNIRLAALTSYTENNGIPRPFSYWFLVKIDFRGNWIQQLISISDRITNTNIKSFSSIDCELMFNNQNTRKNYRCIADITKKDNDNLIITFH